MFKIFDGHYHTLIDIPITETIQSLKQSFKQNGVNRIVLLSCPFYEDSNCDRLQNVKNLFLKYYFGEGVYAFAGLEYNNLDNAINYQNDFLEQAKNCVELGFDGFKMLEGKPFLRKKLKGLRLSDAVYHKFYEYLQQNGVPLTLHNADPCEFWDRNKLSDYAISKGWYNDESNLPKAEMEKDVFDILGKFPKLHLTLAHFGFLTDDYEKAQRFLSDYEYTMLDTTPASEEYYRMCKNPALWKGFLLNNQKRIKFGSDTYNFALDKDYIRAVTLRPNFMKNFFELGKNFEFLGQTYVSFDMPKDFLEDIYYNNAMAEYSLPKRVNVKGLRDKLIWLKEICVRERDIKDIEFMLGVLAN